VLAAASAVAVPGRGWDRLTQYARDHAVDIVVLGSHGHGLVRMTSYEVKAASGVED
jgi:nucleotide-binding universal stress UspA family protein